MKNRAIIRIAVLLCAILTYYHNGVPAALAQSAAMSKNLTVVPISAAKSFDKQALVIGIAGYELARPLTVPPDDARAFAKLLTTRFGFPKDAVVLMTDDPATPERLRPTQAHMRTAINNLIANMTDTSEVVVFFSGHGTIDGDEDWLVPIDGDPGDIKESCISYDSLKKRIDIKQPHRALLVIDACRNLQKGKDTTPSGFGSGSQVDVGPQIAELLSCHPTEVSQEGLPEDFHESVFTHFLLKGLSGAPEALASGTSQVTFDSLRSYVQGNVKQYVSSKFGAKQTPDGRASLGTMVLANIDKTAAPIELDAAAQSFQRAEKLFTEKKNEEAESAYREAVLLEPDNAVYQDKLGQVLLRLKKYDDAEAAARAAVRKVSENAEYQDHLGYALMGLKRYSDSEAAYREAVHLAPTNAQYQVDVGIALSYQGKLVEAETCFREAVRLEPKNAKFQENLGTMLSIEGKDVEAETFYREAVRLEPTVALYQDNLGIALGKQGKDVEAEPFFREAVRLEPTVALYQDNLGVALGRQRKDIEAEPFCREAIRLEPKNAQYQGDLGLALAKQGKYVEAETPYREAVGLEPANAQYQSELGVVLDHQGKHAEAEPFFREAVRLEPTNSMYKTNLDYCLKQIH